LEACVSLQLAFGSDSCPCFLFTEFSASEQLRGKSYLPDTAEEFENIYEQWKTGHQTKVPAYL
jgi:hypothetical protein